MPKTVSSHYLIPSPRFSLASATALPIIDSSKTSLDDDYHDYDTYPAHSRLPNGQILELYAELTLEGEYHLL